VTQTLKTARTQQPPLLSHDPESRRVNVKRVLLKSVGWSLGRSCGGREQERTKRRDLRQLHGGAGDRHRTAAVGVEGKVKEKKKRSLSGNETLMVEGRQEK